jgi:5-methylthioribose kinase
MAYRQLTVGTVPDYLQGVPEVMEHLGGASSLTVQEVGDGNLNFVYIVSNAENPAQSVVLKQAVPFLRVVGESWPLPKERMRIEIKALAKETELCPQHVPQVYHASEEMCLVVMQNLAEHGVLRGRMIQGDVFPRLADHVSTFLAQNLFHTSDLFLDHRTKKEQVAAFINVDLCKITEDFVFTNPYEQHETNVYNPELSDADLAFVHEDRDLKIAVAEMKYAFMNNAQALLHGDLHTGSIMAGAEETYMIDPEFAFYGPMGFDVGAIIANVLMSYFSHEFWLPQKGQDPTPVRTWHLQCVEEIWGGFAQKFDALWKAHVESQEGHLYWDYPQGEAHFQAQRERFLHHVLVDTLGFAACKMMRRILGLAKVADIADIADLKARAEIERKVLTLGKELVVNRGRFENIQEVTTMARNLSPLEGR